MSKTIKNKNADARNCLRRMRESAGLTMRQAGGVIGISHVSISQFENQKLNLPEYRIEQMVMAYGFTMEDFGKMTGRAPVLSFKDGCHAMINRMSEEQLSVVQALMGLLLRSSRPETNSSN